MNQKEIIRKLLKTLAQNTDEPLVNFKGGSSPELIVQLDKKDQGRVIGKNGITIAALTVVMWHSGKVLNGTPTNLVLLEPEGKYSTIPVPFMPQENLLVEDLQEFCETLTEAIGLKDAISISVGPKEAEVKLSIPESMKPSLLDPSFPVAAAHLIKTAGRCCGGVATPVITYAQ